MNLAANAQQRFADQSTLLSDINASLSPIVAAGPEQTGFSAEELAAKNTAAINNAAAANRNAQQAAGNVIAGQGGGAGSGIESGVQQAIKAGISSTEAGNLANQQNEIVQQNYDVGRSNYKTALAGEQALSGDYNPEAFNQEAQAGLSSSFSEANQINTQQQAAGKAILSAGAGLLNSTITPFVTGGISNVLSGGSQAGSETGGGVEQFFSGGLNALNG
jgi:hypothetical protein